MPTLPLLAIELPRIRLSVSRCPIEIPADRARTIVLFSARPNRTPQQKKMPISVALDAILADDRPLRARAGVQPQTCMVVAVAILDLDVVADLPTDAVAVVVPRDHAGGWSRPCNPAGRCSRRSCRRGFRCWSCCRRERDPR